MVREASEHNGDCVGRLSWQSLHWPPFFSGEQRLWRTFVKSPAKARCSGVHHSQKGRPIEPRMSVDENADGLVCGLGVVPDPDEVGTG